MAEHYASGTWQVKAGQPWWSPTLKGIVTPGRARQREKMGDAVPTSGRGMPATAGEGSDGPDRHYDLLAVW